MVVRLSPRPLGYARGDIVGCMGLVPRFFDCGDIVALLRMTYTDWTALL